MADFINKRVNDAQAQLQKRAEKLEALIKSAKTKKTSAEFYRGADLLLKMINNQSKLIDKAVFETPKSRLEQIRNLQLTAGEEFLQHATNSMDAMFEALEEMVR